MAEIEKRTSLMSLFGAFAKVGLFTFGGGMAMLPLLQKEMIAKRAWCTDEELLDYFAVAQCTPGIIAVNTATFVGYKQRGILGGILATFGVVFPSFVIIAGLSSLLSLWMDNAYLIKAFAGIRVAVCALILTSLYKLSRKAIVDVLTLVIFLFVAVLELWLAVSPLIIVPSTIALGIAYHFILSGKKEAAI